MRSRSPTVASTFRSRVSERLIDSSSHIPIKVPNFIKSTVPLFLHQDPAPLSPRRCRRQVHTTASDRLDLLLLFPTLPVLFLLTFSFKAIHCNSRSGTCSCTTIASALPPGSTLVSHRLTTETRCATISLTFVLHLHSLPSPLQRLAEALFSLWKAKHQVLD